MHGKLNDKSRQVIESATAKGLTIGTAESCTGGWIGKTLTDIPGSSAVFMGGIIAYDNDVKLGVLGIPDEILGFYGAVSEPVSGAMAQQARDMLSVDIAVSVTGIAGPGGGTSEKPIGMVCFGLSRRGQKPEVYTKQFGDIGREKIRAESVYFALDLLNNALTR